MGRASNRTAVATGVADTRFSSVLGGRRGPGAGDAEDEATVLWHASATEESRALSAQLCRDVRLPGVYPEHALNLLNAGGPRGARGNWQTGGAHAVMAALVDTTQEPYRRRVDALTLALVADMKLLSVARLPAAINRKLRALALADAQAALRNAGLTLASLTATMEAACEELTLDSFARCLQRNNEQALAALALKGELDYAEWREGLQKWLRMLNTGEKTGASMGWGALHTAAKDTLRQNKIRAMQQAGLVTRPRGARS